MSRFLLSSSFFPVMYFISAAIILGGISIAPTLQDPYRSLALLVSFITAGSFFYIMVGKRSKEVLRLHLLYINEHSPY